MNKKRIVLPLVAGCAALAAEAQDQRPNIVVILTDDMGFSDLGCYGGEIRTPHLDRLAQEGIRMTEMYSSARSCPSRACLMTGLYPHQTGLGHMTGGHVNWPDGYSGFRSTGNVTIAEVLRDAGYFTAMSGKWHLGKVTPVERGFEEYFGLLGGFDSFWDIRKYTRLPEGRPEHTYAEGEFYATDAITDYAIDFAREAQERNQPLFLYLAYNAAHFPLHAPKADIDRYMETYLQGWDKIRDARWRRIVQMGLLEGTPECSPRGVVPESLTLDQTHDLPAWDSLPEEQQIDLARRMAIYAAMVDIMDRNVGRFLDALRQSGQLENTFIVFMSDNGACAEWTEHGFDGRSGLKYHVHTGAELDRMGQPGTYHHYGTGWANVCNTPLSEYKHYAHEGGISTPSILWFGDRVKHPGSIDHQPCHFTDIMATCVDLAEANYPARYKGHAIPPMEGVTLTPMLRGEQIARRDIFAEHEGNRMVRRGRWKLVAAYHRGMKWELYDMKTDRTEQHDLAAEYPEKVEELKTAYYQWADRCHVEPFMELFNRMNPQRTHKLTEYPDR